MPRHAFATLISLCSLLVASACSRDDGDEETETNANATETEANGTEAEGDPETETEGDGDGDGDTAGDGDGDDTDTEGDTADDSASCELWEGDATYPGDCNCASPGEECVQGCLIPDGVQTCADVCAALGETCVENACDGGTYTGGYTCPAPSEYGPAVAHPCDEPVPAMEPQEDFDWGVACCCTRS